MSDQAAKDKAKEKEVKALHDHADKHKVSDIRADKIMNSPVISIYEGTKIYMAVQTLLQKRISGAPVVTKNERLVGVISEYDLLIQTATKDLRDAIQFTRNAITAKPDTSVKELIVMFHKTRVRWMPVVNNENRVLGIVTRLDVLKALLPKT